MSRRRNLIGSCGEYVEGIPSNQIWYTSTDGSIVTPYAQNVFGQNIISNIYEDDKGIITFDGDITMIGNSAFAMRTNLTNIIIPNKVNTIGANAFRGSSNLTSITIPNSVTSIGNYAFQETSLISITIPGRVSSFGVGIFTKCSSLTNVIIDDGITMLPNGIFAFCTSLMSITIPSSITSIDSYAFNGCGNLANIYCKPITPPITSGSLFYYSPDNLLIYVPAASVNAYKTAQYWSEYADNIVGYDFENDTVVGGGSSLITFTVGSVEYQAEEGMTWEDWVNSSYSNDAFFIDGNGISIKETGESIFDTDGTIESPTNSIIDGYGYLLLSNYFPIAM